MIISFTGAQSTGKSTLLNRCVTEFEERFMYFPEITRSIRDKFGVKINESGNDITQLLIISGHIENMIKGMSSEKHCIFDRCVLDGLVYTEWLKNNGVVSSCVYESMSNVFTEYIDKVDIIFYTDPKDVELVYDGERSVDVEFRNSIINSFENYIKYYKQVVKLSGTVEERMNTIKETLKNKGIKL